VGSIGTDREDPSIFTVLTCPSGTPGEPVAEFSIIPPRWLVNDTLRTRHYQRSNVSEFMANVSGKLEGEEE
jgi:homogentisate 1,2-dioxygenase